MTEKYRLALILTSNVLHQRTSSKLKLDIFIAHLLREWFKWYVDILETEVLQAANKQKFKLILQVTNRNVLKTFFF